MRSNMKKIYNSFHVEPKGENHLKENDMENNKK